ncbi:hypothetical protein NIES4071_30360 [Calothrix sp. NIES-4071]|nr:hypothetical protein NIES4071_30360 [Calothrix sp. NIES-4071]BAZ57356.1 hypothetical protein NIES4105_30300 [Calothrix sp. NIES-4105]
MAKYIIYVATSIDGYIARLDGSIDWLSSPEEALMIMITIIFMNQLMRL